MNTTTARDILTATTETPAWVERAARAIATTYHCRVIEVYGAWVAMHSPEENKILDENTDFIAQIIERCRTEEA